MTEIERILKIVGEHSKVISENEVHIITTQFSLSSAIEQYVIKARISELENQSEQGTYFYSMERIKQLKKGLVE